MWIRPESPDAQGSALHALSLRVPRITPIFLLCPIYPPTYMCAYCATGVNSGFVKQGHHGIKSKSQVGQENPSQ